MHDLALFCSIARVQLINKMMMEVVIFINYIYIINFINDANDVLLGSIGGSYMYT